MGSEIKQILKSLCFSHGWSYAVFWRYDPINSMLLRFEEAHNDEQSVALVNDMILQAHILGQGIVGEAALTGNHQWLFSDTLFQCGHDELQNQFLSGFKTIAIIPAGSSGVVQLGSTQKVLESPEMLEQTTRALQETCFKPDESVDLDSLFESLVPLGDCETLVPDSLQGLSFDDIFTDDNPPSLLSPEMMMISGNTCEAASSSSFSHQDQDQDLDLTNGDDFGFDILKSYSLDDLYELLADSPEQNCSSMVIQGNDNDVFDILGMNSLSPPKGLFSEIISSSLSNNSCTSSLTNVQDYCGLNQSKRRKLEASSAHSSSLFPQVTPGSLWMDDERSGVGENWKTPHEEGVKKKKRAKEGESRRPRPKDRQMIQDRIKELRGMIPNGAKCSIDTLLDLTIKHMVFMQSIAKYADRLKEPYEPKLVKEKERTWAVEVGEEAVVCPIIVEDLKTQGQMQIEMECEESEEFLEIADVVRGLGLNILKGVMETRLGQVWAHFIVQANPQVTRLQVFCSLVHLFHHNL